MVGGSENYVGAPRLAAEGAYRAGAGLVTIATTEDVQESLAGSLPEATWSVLGDEDGLIDTAEAPRVIAELVGTRCTPVWALASVMAKACPGSCAAWSRVSRRASPAVSLTRTG